MQQYHHSQTTNGSMWDWCAGICRNRIHGIAVCVMFGWLGFWPLMIVWLPIGSLMAMGAPNASFGTLMQMLAISPAISSFAPYLTWLGIAISYFLMAPTESETTWFRRNILVTTAIIALAAASRPNYIVHYAASAILKVIHVATLCSNVKGADDQDTTPIDPRRHPEPEQTDETQPASEHDPGELPTPRAPPRPSTDEDDAAWRERLSFQREGVKRRRRASDPANRQHAHDHYWQDDVVASEWPT
jgi:hypothetical protein